MASSIVGLKDLVYAPLLDDSASGATYGEVKPLAPAITASTETAEETATQYADNGPIEVVSQIGETTITITASALEQAVLAEILGQEVRKGVIVYKQTATAPYIAIGFKGTKANGKNRNVWLLKGRFATPSDEWNTKADSPEFSNQEITATFIRRDFDEAFKITGDEEVTEFDQYKGTFFDQVFDPAQLDVAPTTP
ncbi:phage tail protein [Halobacillus shinanisalinarum]|uniref:Phage tail protein n=1 Tax=Halobacillus shinanisalinarum TaxID=2932258 RepID=A0ABY4GYY5_9BACI|nr:major tail protein [Halobacillus shinanisalinarum]UOQ93415.1 phage tail protein [Halobacillus shinanisalinarum]